jgi:hypothetical protein
MGWHGWQQIAADGSSSMGWQGQGMWWGHGMVRAGHVSVHGMGWQHGMVAWDGSMGWHGMVVGAQHAMPPQIDYASTN